jgi:DNA primase
MISPDKIEQVKNASDIVEVIGGYLTLKKAGANYKANCPFHQEKTPSFVVSPEKQIYRCFGCGEGGNVFTFLQRLENFSFVDSVKFLAKRAGIEVEDARFSVNSGEKDKLISANKEALEYYREMFLKSEKAKAYAAGRLIDDATAEDFKVGYSPQEGGLAARLKEMGYTEDDMLKSWLAAKGNYGLYDVFRDRFMFPIFNIYGDVIAFGGRVFDDSNPKYINSRETSVYTKGRNLYNLNNARKHASSGEIIIVEGYMDCITVYAAGIKNTVATLGTAMTQDQAKLLKRYAERAVIMYDMDDAGRQGAIRAGDNLFAEGVDACVVSFDGVKDPDDYIKKNGAVALSERIKAAAPFLVYRIEWMKKQGDIKNPYYKEKVIKELAGLVEKVSSAVVAESAVKLITDKLQISREVASRYFRAQSRAVIPDEPGHNFEDPLAMKNRGIDSAERTILATALGYLGTEDQDVVLRHIAELRENLGLKYGDFRNTIYSEVMEKIKGYFRAGEKEILAKIEMDYVDNAEVSSMISEMLVGNHDNRPKKGHVADAIQIVSDCFFTILQHKTNEKLEEIKMRIIEAETSKDIEKQMELIKEKARLDKILDQRGGDIEQES